MYTFSPDYDEAGSHTIICTVTDTMETVSQTWIVEVSNVNRAPVAQDIQIRTDENVGVDIALIASDEDNDPLTFSIMDQPLHGSVVIEGNIATYTPNEDYAGIDSFTYKAFDNDLYSNIALVTVEVIAAVKPLQISITGVSGDNHELLSGEYWSHKPVVVSFEITGEAQHITASIGDVNPEQKTVTIDPDTDPGLHTVIITATDSSGKEVSAMVEINRVAEVNTIVLPEVVRLSSRSRVFVFIKKPQSLRDALIVEVTCDGALAKRKLEFKKRGRAILIFHTKDMNEPIDTYFVVRGTLDHNGKLVTFQGTDAIKKVKERKR